MNCPFYVNRRRQRQSAIFSINLEGDKITMAKCASRPSFSHITSGRFAWSVSIARYYKGGDATKRNRHYV